VPKGNEAIRIDDKDNMRVDVDVAVIDTGIDYQHPDLNVVGRTDCVPDNGDPEAAECIDGSGKDGHSHGTHVAGTITALDDGEGVVGVAPGARLWAVKVLADNGVGYTSWIIAGVDWVTAHAFQVEVANMSLGSQCPNPALDEAIEASCRSGRRLRPRGRRQRLADLHELRRRRQPRQLQQLRRRSRRRGAGGLHPLDQARRRVPDPQRHLDGLAARRWRRGAAGQQRKPRRPRRRRSDPRDDRRRGQPRMDRQLR
jgi:hypothetical protein